jgi:hypothetical protein
MNRKSAASPRPRPNNGVREKTDNHQNCSAATNDDQYCGESLKQHFRHLPPTRFQVVVHSSPSLCVVCDVRPVQPARVSPGDPAATATRFVRRAEPAKGSHGPESRGMAGRRWHLRREEQPCGTARRETAWHVNGSPARRDTRMCPTFGKPLSGPGAGQRRWNISLRAKSVQRNRSPRRRRHPWPRRTSLMPHRPHG